MNDNPATSEETNHTESDSYQGEHSLRDVTLIWLGMLLLTGATWFVSDSSLAGKSVMSFVMLTIVVKGHWIISEFMELKECALKWKIIMNGWLLIVCLVIAVFTFL